ncbi:MAG: serine/threonine-protein kinase [Acidobacteriota bacterium]|nr:MAG: serine/threonine-protein kinase [Acidobacteriota bacterium]
MTLSEGAKIGRYEIRSLIGVGGMGEVYRASDPKIGRDVAIKVLPADLSADKDRVARFEQEARAAGALNHPNIIAIHDIDTQNEIVYVVSELLEGGELRARLDEGAMPLRKVTEYAQQIVSGLTAAHEKGIVHRDLKPENLFITKDDRIKILDFGLAKLSDRGASAGGQTGNEDATRKALTNPGVVMGTVGYMSPEQVRGQQTDHRSDIFSFGLILYEMITGRRAFQEESLAETMSAIVKEEPTDMTESNPNINPSLERIVRRCLEKKPERRFQTASDLGFALESLSAPTSSSGATMTTAVSAIGPETETSLWKARIPWIAAGALALMLISFGAWTLLRPASALPPFVSLDIAAPAGWTTKETSALSPDGSLLAFAAEKEKGKPHLWLRTLATGESQMVADSEGAVEPFWSPDGAEVAYFTNERLRAFNLATGRSRVICDVFGQRKAGTWNSNGVIVFSNEGGVPLKRINADGKSLPLDMPHKGYRPFFLPDGRHFLFGKGVGILGQGGIFVGDLESDEVKDIRGDGREPKYAGGYLFFVLDGGLKAQAFTPASFKLSGEPIPVADVGIHTGDLRTNFSVAANGVIAFRSETPVVSETAWYLRDGTRTTIDDASSFNPVFSPDDSMIAFQRDGDIWLFDVVRGSARMFASGKPTRLLSSMWTPDGSAVLFVRQSVGVAEKPLKGGPERTVIEDNSGYPFVTQMISDGRALGVKIREGSRDIFIRSSNGDETYFAQSPANETMPALSPDERWLAYATSIDISGDISIFIEAFPNGGSKIRLTGDISGAQPRWRRDGRELYFVAADGSLMAVTVEEPGGALKLGAPKPLFKTTIAIVASVGARSMYDATRDGSRFFVTEEKKEPAADTQPVTVLVNWQSIVTKR